ncbi:MAG: diphosphomevalonate decarboxylase [Candidatus Aenigmatarchaeota archaeon]
MTKKASAIANSNIALVKYWGKRNEDLILPYNSSISVTLDKIYTHTTVEFSENLKRDILIINDKEIDTQDSEYEEYVGRFLKKLRELYPNKAKNLNAKIVSKNNFPTAAGLASSASGFAALALACNEALELNLSKKELSILARLGSGSACRSIYGGFVEWKKGIFEDGRDSYAEQIATKEHWPDFRIIICITSSKEKKIKSRAGMKQTVLTSPFYKAWLETIEDDIRLVKKGIIEKDFKLVGSVAELNCLKMHSTMITTKPPIIYWNGATIEIINLVLRLREEGIECYFTIDAGPQVKILCLEEFVKDIVERVKEMDEIENIIITSPGDDAKVTNEHLF